MRVVTGKFTLYLKSTTDIGDMSLTPGIQNDPPGNMLDDNVYSYPEGTVVMLTVSSNAVDWFTSPHRMVTFPYWDGDLVSKTNTYPVTATVKMDADKTITAFFRYSTFDDTP